VILAESRRPQVEKFDRQGVVLIPTGSNEQHGRHLPLHTDSLLVTAFAREVERRLPDQILLTPTLWLGASAHHLAFPGTLSASLSGYQEALQNVVESLVPHGFEKFYVVNGHGGNTEPNGLALRGLKERRPNLTYGHSGYFSFIPDALLREKLRGPQKGILHACEAETSLMLHLHPELVHMGEAVDDGLEVAQDVPGLIHHFDERTEEGVLGYATFASAETGKALFEAAVERGTEAMRALADGIELRSMKRPT
jgi:creatinine amidohydrolase